MYEMSAGFSVNKFATEKFLSLIRFAHDLYAFYDRLNVSRLARFRSTMTTCESDKPGAMGSWSNAMLSSFCNF